ncbi:MAG: DnaJ C-terminal domain-containing protein, partial [Candidatus Omnitrophota bacterium]
VFDREGNDIICEVPVTFVQVTLGAEISVPSLEGKLKMKVPAGTQNGRVFRLKGKGITDINGYGRGDQLVRIVVEVPTKLNPKQKELLKEFESSGGGYTPKINSFMDNVRRFFQ